MWVPSTVTRLEPVVVVPKAHNTGPLMVPAAHRHLLCLRLGLGLGLRLRLRRCRRSEFFASVLRAVLCGAQPHRPGSQVTAKHTAPGPMVPSGNHSPAPSQRCGHLPLARPACSPYNPCSIYRLWLPASGRWAQGLAGSRWVIAQGGRWRLASTTTSTRKKPKDPLLQPKCALSLQRARDAK